MSTSPSCLFVTLQLFAAMMLNLSTCQTRPDSNTWVVQVDGGLTGAERIAAEKDLILLGQVREQSPMIYRVVIAVVIFTMSGSRITRELNLSTDLNEKHLCFAFVDRLEVWKDFICSSIIHILNDQDAMPWILHRI